MSRAHRIAALALAIAALAPAISDAQRSGSRPPPPTVIVRPPASPPVIGIVPGNAPAARPGNAMGAGTAINRSMSGWRPGYGYVPRSQPASPPVFRNGHQAIPFNPRVRGPVVRGPFVSRSGFHRGCRSAFCGTTVIFGLPYFMPIPYGVAVPVETPITSYYDPGLYATQPEVVEAPPVPMPRDTSFAHSKLIIVGGENGRGGDALTIEQLGDSVLRLTWLGSIRPIREARVFVADSAQRTLRSQRVDAATPSALFETKAMARRVAFAGVTVTFTDGVVSMTLVPVRVGNASGKTPER